MTKPLFFLALITCALLCGACGDAVVPLTQDHSCLPITETPSGVLAIDLLGSWQHLNDNTSRVLTFASDGRWWEVTPSPGGEVPPRVVEAGDYRVEDDVLILSQGNASERAEFIEVDDASLRVFISDDSDSALQYQRVECSW